jgi:hypothetical protein
MHEHEPNQLGTAKPSQKCGVGFRLACNSFKNNGTADVEGKAAGSVQVPAQM